jgi:hypothetical protein
MQFVKCFESINAGLAASLVTRGVDNSSDNRQDNDSDNGSDNGLGKGSDSTLNPPPSLPPPDWVNDCLAVGELSGSGV